MTSEEAKAFLSLHDIEDIDDRYDEMLFEQKQYFLSKAPIHKVFESRLNKVRKISSAFEVLYQKQEPSIIESNQKMEFSDEVKLAFDAYESWKTTIKFKISASRTFSELINTIGNYLKGVEEYQNKWLSNMSIDAEVVLGKEPDVMEMLQAIKEFEENGHKYFSDIENLKGNNLLLKEMKRVSLLFKNKES